MLRTLLSILGVYRIYEKWLLQQVKNKPKPKHIGVILDGNRRWATDHSLDPKLGHHYGADKTEEVLRWCLDLGIESITLYVFSTENFKRSRGEIEDLMNLFEERLRKLKEDKIIHKHKVRIKAIGRIHLLPERLQKLIKEIEETTKKYDNHFLNLAIAYGGRAEIIDATKKIAKKILSGELSIEDINEKTFEKNLYTSHLPKQDPDLIIRTSGEERLSGFLLYQSAYSELFFIDVYWPEFRHIDLLRTIRTYQRRKRRFGK